MKAHLFLKSTPTTSAYCDSQKHYTVHHRLDHGLRVEHDKLSKSLRLGYDPLERDPDPANQSSNDKHYTD